MNEEIVVSLCDKTGNMVKPWAEAGYECYAVDIQHSIRRDRREGNINYVWGDVRSWTPPKRPRILFGFTPCTNLCTSGARDWQKKSWPMLRDGMDLFFAAYTAAQWAGVPYMLENPVGRISGIAGEFEHEFTPWEYGDDYQKKTCLWTGNGFVMPPKKSRLSPRASHKKYGPVRLATTAPTSAARRRWVLPALCSRRTINNFPAPVLADLFRESRIATSIETQSNSEA